MSLKASPIEPVPGETARVARAAFRKGNLLLELRDLLGTVFSDEDFADLFPKLGRPGLPPWRKRRRHASPAIPLRGGRPILCAASSTGTGDTLRCCRPASSSRPASAPCATEASGRYGRARGRPRRAAGCLPPAPNPPFSSRLSSTFRRDIPARELSQPTVGCRTTGSRRSGRSPDRPSRSQHTCLQPKSL